MLTDVTASVVARRCQAAAVGRAGAATPGDGAIAGSGRARLRPPSLDGRRRGRPVRPPRPRPGLRPARRRGSRAARAGAAAPTTRARSGTASRRCRCRRPLRGCGRARRAHGRRPRPHARPRRSRGRAAASSSAWRRSPRARAHEASPDRANAAWSAKPASPARSSARRYASVAASPSFRRSATHASSSIAGTRNASNPIASAWRCASAAMAATVEASPAAAAMCARRRLADCERPVVSASFERRTRLLRQRGAALDVAGSRDRKRERRLRQPDLRRVGPGRCERERALADLDRGVEVELFGREEAEDGKRLEPPIERNVVRRLGERELDESPPFGHALREREVPGERRQAGGDAAVACIARVRERGPQVVVLELEPVGATSPVASAKLPPALRRRASRSTRRAPAGRRRDGRSRQDARARTPAPCRARRSAHPRRGTTRRGSTCRPARRAGTSRSPRRALRSHRRRRATATTRRRGAPRPGGAATSRPRARGRSSTRRAPRARHGPRPTPAGREAARGGARRRAGAPRARER